MEIIIDYTIAWKMTRTTDTGRGLKKRGLRYCRLSGRGAAVNKLGWKNEYQNALPSYDAPEHPNKQTQ